MTGIQERITEVLMRELKGNVPLAEHLASVLVAELGLHERFTWSWPSGSAPGIPGYGYEVDTAQEAAEEAGGCNIVSRYVTPWSPA